MPSVYDQPSEKLKARALSIRHFFLFVFLFFSSQVAFSEQWYYSFVPHSRHVNSVKILDTSRIVIGGGNESNDSLRDIYLSHNKGLSWAFSANSIDPWIKSMAFSDTSNALAVGYTGTILKTTNGAVSWIPVSMPINRQFMKVVYADPQTAYIVGGSVPRLIDDTLQTILKSIDSGKTWSVQLDRKGYWLRGVTFTDVNHGIAIGDSGVILKTTNGGANWNTISSPVIRTWNAVKFISPSIGYIVGGRAYPDSASTILRTTDSGATWNVLRDDLLGTLSDITFLNSTTGYIVGDHSTVLKTTNGGLNWTPVIIPNSLPTDNFNTVDFYNDHFGIVAGRYGQSYIYTNSSLPQVFTQNSIFIDTTSRTLTGSINTHGQGGLYTFFYSKDSLNPYYSSDYPFSITNNFLQQVSTNINGLPSNTTYYYYLQGQTLAGTVNGDTLSFNTGIPVFTFQTMTATDIANTSATLNGLIDKFAGTANISFEYGTTPAFGSEISATPNTVSDTFSHSVSASLINLLPATVYYFRLKATHNTESYIGYTLMFTTGGVFKTFQTVEASAIFDSSATLNGKIDKFVVPVSLSFEYGSTNTLGQEVPAVPFFVNDTLQHLLTANLTNLVPNTPYYFRLKGQTSLGTYTGDILTFNAGAGYSLFSTIDATNITDHAAQLHASANHFLSPVSFSFEYGTTLAFGNSVTATPSGISDTFYHSIFADISGLQADQLYYYRIKAFNGTASFYGDTKQFYTGLPEIPNWDFQYWSTDTVNIPKNWNMINEHFERVPGHSGNYAMKLSGQSIFFNGYIGGKHEFIGGVPLNAGVRPDSVACFINYDVASGDSAQMLVVLKKQTHFLSQKFYPITGNSGGIFKRVAYKIAYDSLAVPDTVIMAFATVNIQGGSSPNFNNYLVIDDISFLPGNTTFLNSGFEDWFSSIIERPLSWFSLRYIALDPDHPDSNHMISKVYFNAPGDFAAEVKNINWASQGMIVDGELNTKNLVDEKAGGFPIRGRHLTFNGYYKFFPVAGDTLQINVDLTRGDTTLGTAYMIFYDSVPDFTPFSIPIIYNDSTEIPDSANIGFRIQNTDPKVGTRYVVDKLSFDGFVSGINNSKPDLLELDGMKVYPNPARDQIMIENLTEGNKKCSLSLFSINGEIIKEIDMTNQRFAQMDIGNLATGTYILLMKKGEQLFNKKIIIQK